LFAIENRCPHQQRSAFHQAQVDGCVIRCPMHGWTFDLRTGDPVAGSGRLRTFEVRESGNAVYVRRPEEAATPQFGLWE
jgi:3-phenylpropionate/trans-cinnamate dioxygenase ferredoxin subunit